MTTDPGKNSFDNLWFVGVILATFASFVSNLGLNLQKLLHLRNQGKPAEVRDSYYKFGLWWLGVSLISIGAVADFAALTFAPQSMVAPLGSLTLVSNIILSPIILKEIITTWDIVSTLTIVCGCIISVAFASHEDVVYSNDELFDFYLRWPFLIYFAVVISFMVLCYIAMRHYELIESDHQRYTPTEESWHRLTYPAISGTIGAQSVLFAKCFVEMIVNSFEHRGLLFERWQAYFIILAMAGCIVFQIKWLNDGLLRFDASFTVPVFQAFWVVLSVASGLVFYNEYRGMNTLQKGLFALGIVITITGVIMLSRSRRVHRPGHVDSDDEEGDTLDDQDGGVGNFPGARGGSGSGSGDGGDGSASDDDGKPGKASEQVGASLLGASAGPGAGAGKRRTGAPGVRSRGHGSGTGSGSEHSGSEGEVMWRGSRKDAELSDDDVDVDAGAGAGLTGRATKQSQLGTRGRASDGK